MTKEELKKLCIENVIPKDADIPKDQDRDEILAEIAKTAMRFPSLETRKSDSLDFHEVSAWGAKLALQKAYEVGRVRGQVQMLTLASGKKRGKIGTKK